jgi:DNA-binding CsgD family transcriptional regulator
VTAGGTFPDSRAPVTVIVGVDGSGRTHRLRQLVGAAGPGTVLVGPQTTSAEALRALLDVDPAPSLLAVDDAHRLDPGLVAELIRLARAGTPMVLTRRPTVSNQQLADLDAELAARGRVEVLPALGEDAVAELLGPAGADRVGAVLAGSCGLAAVAACLAEAPPGAPPPALVARVQRRITLLDPAVATVARLLSLRLDLPDDVLAAASELNPVRAAAAVLELREAGFVAPDGEAVVPAVGDVIVAEQSPAQLRLLHDQVARALLAAGVDVLPAARAMRAARLRTPAAAQVYRSAGERLLWDDPVRALGWLDEAVDAGLDPGQVALPRAEAGLLVDLVDDVDLEPAPGTDPERVRRVQGAQAAHAGRSARAAELLLAGGDLGRLLAVPSLVAIGQLDAARRCAGEPGPASLRLLAEAALRIGEPDAAVPGLIEAIEAIGAGRPGAVLPDTPYALTAPIAVLAGDAAIADRLLADAVTAGLGGPAVVQRHRLLLAWVRLRAGRFDTAVTELAAIGPIARSGRDRLLCATLQAGLARRSGDVARLRDAWARAEQVLARRTVDLFQLEMLEELLVAAVRLRQSQRVTPILSELDDAVAGLGRPPVWVTALGWLRLQLAVVAEDVAGVAAQAELLAGLPVRGGRQQAQRAAALAWRTALEGHPDADRLGVVLDALAAHQLPWEASRLAGQAAIRTTDPTLARRLLERARDLSSAEVQLDAARAVTPASGLSEREIEVAQLVAAGRTHREIGGQLFLSPKTVEHHVARIRNKLGATSRAEFLAALRSVLGENLSSGSR